jgi:hypothetical protein
MRRGLIQSRRCDNSRRERVLLPPGFQDFDPGPVFHKRVKDRPLQLRREAVRYSDTEAYVVGLGGPWRLTMCLPLYRNEYELP